MQITAVSISWSKHEQCKNLFVQIDLWKLATASKLEQNVRDRLAIENVFTENATSAQDSETQQHSRKCKYIYGLSRLRSEIIVNIIVSAGSVRPLSANSVKSSRRRYEPQTERLKPTDCQMKYRHEGGRAVFRMTQVETKMAWPWTRQKRRHCKRTVTGDPTFCNVPLTYLEKTV